MRGDSLRDFYAKVLALMGLGLLACAGAVVDYWPTHVEPPLITRAPRLPPAATLVQRLDLEIPAPTVPLGASRRLAARPKLPMLAMVVARAEVPLGVSVPLSRPTVSLPLSSAVDVPAAPVDLPAPLLVNTLPDPVPSSPAAPGEDEANGFFSGAMRKTRDSIVRTGVVTGSSIAGAFRGFLGVFKKVNPF